MWSNTPVYTYVTTSRPHYTFHYLPYTKVEQAAKLAEWDVVEDLHFFLEEIFSDRMVLVSERSGSMTHDYCWPRYDHEAQDHLFSHLDEVAVLEMAAYLLGGTLKVDAYGMTHFHLPHPGEVAITA
jgi:hypothetical protein